MRMIKSIHTQQRIDLQNRDQGVGLAVENTD